MITPPCRLGVAGIQTMVHLQVITFSPYIMSVVSSRIQEPSLYVSHARHNFCFPRSLAQGLKFVYCHYAD